MKSQSKITSPFLEKRILFLGFIFLQTVVSLAQGREDLDFYFETDSISVEQGKTFTNFLVVRNSTSQEININDLVPTENYPGTLLLPPKKLILKPSEERRFPVKYIVNTDFMKKESSDIAFEINYNLAGQPKIQLASFFAVKKIEKQLALYSFSRENFINPSSTETTVSVYLENRSYSRRSIRVIFSSQPDNLKITPTEQTITLEDREKKLIEVQVSLKRKNDFYPDYNIQVETIDLMGNENVGSTNLKVIALSNNRQVVRGLGPQHGKNFVEAAYSESSSQNFLQFRGNTEFSIGQEINGSFNLSGDYFLQDDKYNLYDTWIEFERKGTLFRAGNIHANDYDYSISGKGAKIKTAIGNKKEIEVFALENNYSLFGNYFPEDKGSRLIGAKYNFESGKTLNGKVSYLFDHNPRLKTDSHLVHGESSFSLFSIHNFRVEAGLGYEKGLIYEDKNSGVSAAVDYNVHSGNWDFRSINAYSSKYYIGLNRGSFNFNQNIAYKLGATKQIFFNYQNAEVAPEYLRYQTINQGSGNVNYRPDYYYSSQSAQIGFQFVFANWNVLLAPQIEKQKNIANFNSNELLSYRFRSNLGSSFGNHSINLSLEYSYSKADYLVNWFHSFKSNLSYRFRNFSLNGSFQANPNNVIDLNQNIYTDTNFVNYNVYASYNFQAFARDLTGSLSLGTNFSGLYENKNQNVNGNLEYKISNSWAATGYGNYSHFASTHAFGYAGDNYQFRVGIKKYFIPATTIGNHKVSLQIFEDSNGNGKLDTDEKTLANEAVKLNEYVAVTDMNGKVTFQNVPKGIYILKVNENAQSRLMMDPDILVDKNLKLKVGLINNQRVKGNLKEIKQAYDILETDVRGVIVYAKSEVGKVTTTVVDQNNEFEFFLKDGIYDIYIENEKYRFHNQTQRIEVKNGLPLEALIFEYSKKDTTIKVKKF